MYSCSILIYYEEAISAILIQALINGVEFQAKTKIDRLYSQTCSINILQKGLSGVWKEGEDGGRRVGRDKTVHSYINGHNRTKETNTKHCIVV